MAEIPPWLLRPQGPPPTRQESAQRARALLAIYTTTKKEPIGAVIEALRLAELPSSDPNEARVVCELLFAVCSESGLAQGQSSFDVDAYLKKAEAFILESDLPIVEFGLTEESSGI